MWINNFFSVLLIFVFSSVLFSNPLRAFEVSAQDREFLEQIQKDTFQFFIRSSHKATGFTKDSSQPGSPSSIAATGFSLASFAIAHEHEWVPRDYAYNYLLKTLKALDQKAAHEKGFFYHFIDGETGERVWGSEASSIDTALLIAGALLAAQYFPESEVETLAHKIYNRIDWEWMMNGSDLISMGWKPESGFLPYYWDSYNELIILQALAIGSPTHPVPSEAWDAWLRNIDEYRGKEIVFTSNGSLFTYQYSHAFIDFRNLDDAGINYFDNSVKATLANREYSLSYRNEYKTYSENSWGLSASLGPGGYKAYGGKPGEGYHDGTVAPYAALGSIVFTPEESISAIRFFYENYKDKIYGHFGFKGAFNLNKNWWANEYLGIDQGIIVLMLENYLQDGAVWDRFMQLASIQRWIKKCNLLAKTDSASAIPAEHFSEGSGKDALQDS